MLVGEISHQHLLTMKLFVANDRLNEYHNFMIQQDMLDSYCLGFRLVAQLKSNGNLNIFFTLAFIDKNSIDEAYVWADLNNITISKNGVE